MENYNFQNSHRFARTESRSSSPVIGTLIFWLLFHLQSETMSAYALPGLFPPIEPSVPKETGNASASSLHSEFCSSPLHEQNDFTAKSIVEKSGSMFSLSPYLLSSSKPAIEDESEGNRIHVTEAKVDPVRLVQSVTQSSRPKASSAKKNQLRRRSSKDRLDESVKNPPTSEESKGRKGGDSRSFHDEAIEFALNITFNGRKYTAKRTMQRIIQLRDDLIAEMDDRRRWLVLRKSKFSPSSTADECEFDVDVEIPEIPPLTGEEDGSGASFVGRGFSMLHAMATSYVPVMERWLRNVLDTVPQDSETLMNFLWEPLAHDSPMMGSPTKSCVTLATLGSIKELECATDDSESEDEWEG